MPSYAPRPTFVAVNLSAIQHNVRRLRKITNTRVMAVVKANSYGHGAVEVARAAVDAGAEWLGVAFAAEGVALRQAGLGLNILVLGYTPPELAAEAIGHDLSLAVYDLDIAKAYAESARSQNRRARVHVKVDSGMGRLGIAPGEAARFVEIVSSSSSRAVAVGLSSGLVVEGIFTHFATADESDQSFAREQLGRFQNAVASLKVRPLFVHAANSAAALSLPDSRFDLVRAGIAMYGLHPSADVKVPADFIAALEWKSTVSQVKTLPPGAPVSYGREYFTQGTERIAVIPVGYADGFRRSPKNVAQVIVGGRRVPVVGRVCMDQIMANVSEVRDVRIGDEVVLIGNQGRAQITADDAAAWWGTINYDVTSGIMARVPRVYSESNVSDVGRSQRLRTPHADTESNVSDVGRSQRLRTPHADTESNVSDVGRSRRLRTPQAEVFKIAAHNPAHLFRAGAVYIITGATYQKLPHLQTDLRKSQWLSAFKKAAAIYSWEIIAWVVLSNHYHVIVRAPQISAANLPKFIASYHKFTARQWNDEGGKSGRKVWWNYWDTCIRTDKDYLARLNYVSWNPVKHRIVSNPEDYEFSSYRELLATQGEVIRSIETAHPYTAVEDVPDDF